MSEHHPRRLAALRRILVSWYTPAAIGLFLLLALAMWALPRPIERTVTDPATGKGHTVTTWDTSRWQALATVWWRVLLRRAGALGVTPCAVWLLMFARNQPDAKQDTDQ